MGCDNSYGAQVYAQEVCDYQTNHTQECLDLIQRCYTGDRGICVAYVLFSDVCGLRCTIPDV